LTSWELVCRESCCQVCCSLVPAGKLVQLVPAETVGGLAAAGWAQLEKALGTLNHSPLPRLAVQLDEALVLAELPLTRAELAMTPAVLALSLAVARGILAEFEELESKGPCEAAEVQSWPLLSALTF